MEEKGVFARCDGYIYGCNSADSQRENRNVSSRAELGAGQSLGQDRGAGRGGFTLLHALGELRKRNPIWRERR